MAIEPIDAATITIEQEDLLYGLVLGSGSQLILPAEAVGVGATWVQEDDGGNIGGSGQRSVYELTSLDGDLVTYTYEIDFAEVEFPAEVFESFLPPEVDVDDLAVDASGSGGGALDLATMTMSELGVIELRVTGSLTGDGVEGEFTVTFVATWAITVTGR